VPSVLFDLLVPNRSRESSNTLNRRRIAVQLPPFFCATSWATNRTSQMPGALRPHQLEFPFNNSKPIILSLKIRTGSFSPYLRGLLKRCFPIFSQKPRRRLDS
jgi:hypothetical protein